MEWPFLWQSVHGELEGEGRTSSPSPPFYGIPSTRECGGLSLPGACAGAQDEFRPAMHRMDVSGPAAAGFGLRSPIAPPVEGAGDSLGGSLRRPVKGNITPQEEQPYGK